MQALPLHQGLRLSSLQYGATNRVRGAPNLAQSRMRTLPLGPSVELPVGATKRVRGVPNWVCVTHAGGPIGTFGGAPYGATKRVRGVPKWAWVTHAGCAIGTFGGAPMRPRNVCGVCRNGWRGRMRAAPLGPSVELVWCPKNSMAATATATKTAAARREEERELV